MSAQRLRFLFLNLGHFIDHLFMLIFAKAAFDAGKAWGLGYDDMIIYGTPAAVLFGAAAPLSAQAADKWGRNPLIVVFFIGIGIASILASFAETPLQLGFGLALIGIFASIYHPVGITMVIQGGGRVGWRLGVNGVWGNMGVAAAPLITGFILASYDWRLAFIIPGLVSIGIGLAFWYFVRSGKAVPPPASAREKAMVGMAPGWKRALISLGLVTMGGGFVFGALIFLIPRLFEVKLNGISTDVAMTGLLAGAVYATAAFAQIAVGRIIDNRPIKPVLVTIAAMQPVIIFIMAYQADWTLFLVAFLAMAAVFGQIPITDAVLSRYVPDKWRAKVLSIKFMLNLTIGASVLPFASYVLDRSPTDSDGFQTILLILAAAACLIVSAALILPRQAAGEQNMVPAPQPAE
jgi:MFS family permease